VRAGQAGAGDDARDPFLAEVARVSRAVAPVVCRSGVTEKPVDRILGTAFFVSETGEFVTADHVIAAGARNCRKAVYLPVNGWSPDPESEIRLFNFTRCVRDLNADIAVCRTDLDLSESANIGIAVTPLTFNTGDSQDGTPVAFTGFPLEIRYPLTARGYLAASQPAFVAGGLPRLVLDRIAWPGSSGSPVYGANGLVMGMVIERGIERSTGLSFARPATLIVEVVAKFRQQHPTPDAKVPAVEIPQPVENPPPAGDSPVEKPSPSEPSLPRPPA
jgi:S1-C subfamily serine protease